MGSCQSCQTIGLLSAQLKAASKIAMAHVQPHVFFDINPSFSAQNDAMVSTLVLKKILSQYIRLLSAPQLIILPVKHDVTMRPYSENSQPQT